MPIDLAYHLQVRRQGNAKTVKRAIAVESVRPLDHDLPLWQITFYLHAARSRQGDDTFFEPIMRSPMVWP